MHLIWPSKSGLLPLNPFQKQLYLWIQLRMKSKLVYFSLFANDGQLALHPIPSTNWSLGLMVSIFKFAFGLLASASEWQLLTMICPLFLSVKCISWNYFSVKFEIGYLQFQIAHLQFLIVHSQFQITNFKFTISIARKYFNVLFQHF